MIQAIKILLLIGMFSSWLIFAEENKPASVQETARELSKDKPAIQPIEPLKDQAEPSSPDTEVVNTPWVLDFLSPPKAQKAQSSPLKKDELSSQDQPEVVTVVKARRKTQSSRRAGVTPSVVLKKALWKGDAQFTWEKAQSGYEALMRVKNYLKVDHRFSEIIDFHTEWLLNVQQGSAQTIFSKGSNNPIQMLSLNIGYQPLDNLDVRAGAFNMDSIAGYGSYRRSRRIRKFSESFYKAPLLIVDWPFIGFSQKYSWTPKLISPYVGDLFFLARQTVPSDTSTLNRFDQIQKLPQFFTGTVFAHDISFAFPYWNDWDWKVLQEQFFMTAQMTGFYFRNPSSSMAEAGRTFGNTIKKYRVGADSEFEYSFYGIHSSAGVYFNLFPNLDVEIKTSFLWNLGAEKRKNKGQSLILGFYMPLMYRITLNPSVEYFVTQSDASLAYYNASKYGHSGRYGYIFNVRVNFDRYKTFINVQYGNVRSIYYSRSAHGHPRYFKFSLGTDYGKI